MDGLRIAMPMLLAMVIIAVVGSSPFSPQSTVQKVVLAIIIFGVSTAIVNGIGGWFSRAEAETKMFPGKPYFDLHKAAIEGNVQRMSNLITEGSKVNFKQSDGATPLHFAVQGGHPEAVKLLLEHGADVNAQGASGITPLVLAFTSENFDLATLLRAR